ncbi:MAG: hydrogenase 3 maturation endopeptidase HyCI [Anaerolineales bacterium]
MPNSWKVSLNQLLNQLAAETAKSARVAIVGIGNNLRCDDAAGMLIAGALSQHGFATNTDRILIVEAGQAPENATADLRKFAPGLVLLIDAAEMGQQPGAARWIPMDQIDGMSASTHSLPLSMLAHYLTLELNCTVALLGIQPGSNEVGDTLSPEVLEAVHRIVDGIDESLTRYLSAPKAEATGD